MNSISRRLLIGLIAAMMFGLPAVAHAEQQSIPVYMNGEPVIFHIDPILKPSGTTLVEFRTIFERLGLEIKWDQKTSTVTGTKEGLTIRLTIGREFALVNGERKELTEAPVIVNDRTFVPLRFVGEAAGSYVEWNAEEQAIRLYRIAPEQSYTTTNRFIAKGYVPSESAWVRFDIYKEDTKEYSVEFAEAAEGEVEHEVYLPFGTGRYNIQMFHTASSRQDTGEYIFNAEFAVVNEGSSGFAADAAETDDSRVGLYGETNQDVRTIIIGVYLDGSSTHKWVYLEPIDGFLDTSLYLNLGPGSYTVYIYTTDESMESTYFQNMALVETIYLVNHDTRDPDLLPSELVESEHPDIVALAQQITAGKTTDADKSRAIHDWVVNNIAYDAATFLSGGDRIDSALQTLQGKLTDCDGYARLNTALHRAVGMKARIVIGTAIDRESGETWPEEEDLNHAWNEIYYNNRWVVQDPTWNAGYIDPDTSQFVRHVTYTYYDPSPEVFALDHRAAAVDYRYE